MPCRQPRSGLLGTALILCCGFFGGLAARADGIAEAWQGTHWGETSSALIEHFGARATRLRRPIDFGDSDAQVVLLNVVVGGVPLVAFFQMDKATGGLKRIQIERQRHGVNPPAFRAVVGALEAAYGAPGAVCGVAPGPAGGYQAADELVWSRANGTVRAIFRDTTIEAFEGCLAGGPSLGPCGLTGQILVRISPAGVDPVRCPLPLPAR